MKIAISDNLVFWRDKEEIELGDITILTSDNSSSPFLGRVAREVSISSRRKLVEFPECGMHPEEQLFILNNLISKGEKVIVSTYSEYVFLRYMRMLREGELEHDDGTVKCCSIMKSTNHDKHHIKELEFDNEGDLLTNFKGGFYEEGFRERFEG